MNGINNEGVAKLNVSVLARLVPAVALSVAAFGAAGTAFYVRYVLSAMRDAESAGVSAVAGGLAEANLIVLIGLYLATALAMIGMLVYAIRMFAHTKTASPSILFFVGVSLVGMLALVFLWTAESTLIGALNRETNPAGIATAAFTINLLTILSMIAAPFAILIMLAASVLPLSTNTKRRWTPVIGMLLVAALLIILTVAFQVRASWLYQVKLTEHW